MRKILIVTFLAVAATAQQRGVYLEDIDKSVNACTNFFDYANGAWRKANPIPASMTRWSRRWAAALLRLFAIDVAIRGSVPPPTRKGGRGASKMNVWSRLRRTRTDFVNSGRSMKGWLRVDSKDVEGDELDVWVDRGLAFARSLPAKR